jgi:channel protein (hemolysin III family)
LLDVAFPLTASPRCFAALVLAAIVPPAHPIPGFSEPVCSLTHLVACGVFAVLSYFLIKKGKGHGGRIAALAVYAFSTVLLLSVSGVYHLLEPGSSGRAVLQRLDHAAIFALIAGTFTAAHGILFRGPWRWGMIALVWTLAIAGITLKTIFFEGFPEWLGLIFYLGLGWIGIVSGIKVWRVHGWLVFQPLLWGGVAYSVGAVFDFVQRPVLVPGVVGPHEVFHVAVIAGVAYHWWFVYRFADHPPGATPAEAVSARGDTLPA